jgi:hypothetical protein
MDGLSFYPTKVKKCGLAYIALSHVKNIQSLYLISKLQKENFTLLDSKLLLKLKGLKESQVGSFNTIFKQ